MEAKTNKLEKMKHSKIRGLIGSKRFALEELSEGFFIFFLVFSKL
ncbi:hypothetical protein DB41_AA00220 [Neochlamydia sp. TUME1]|nr:hypothetical protein DB41_AA00220 [Neochlamydia sp. TUME1]